MPCYNEAATVAETVRRVLASPYTAELIIVDDGSTDESRKILADIHDERVRVIEQPENRGKGAALARTRCPRHGTRSCSSKTPTSSTTPSEYGKLLAPLLDDKADVVFGSRFHTSRPHRVLVLLAHGREQSTDVRIEPLHQSQPHRHGDVFQGVPARSARLVHDRGEPLRRRTGDHREGRREATGASSRSGSRTTAAPTMKVRRSAGRTACTRCSASSTTHVSPNGCAVAATTDERRRRSRRQSTELAETLESLDDASNYSKWIIELIAPYLGTNILEIGAGHGALTARLATVGHVTATEPSPRAATLLRERFATNPMTRRSHT